MTEMLNKEFSRKSFLKGGGALIVGFSAGGRRDGRQGGRGDRPVREPRPGRSERRRLVPDHPCRQHGVAQLGPHRARPGLDHRPADDRRRGARHGRQPVPAHLVRHRRRDPVAEHRQHRRQHVHLAGRPARAPRRGGGEAGAARDGRDEPRRARSRASRSRRASSPAAARPSPTASSSATSCSTSSSRRRR